MTGQIDRSFFIKLRDRSNVPMIHAMSRAFRGFPAMRQNGACLDALSHRVFSRRHKIEVLTE
jgi:uncharacterized protein (DUF2461 family)